MGKLSLVRIVIPLVVAVLGAGSAPAAQRAIPAKVLIERGLSLEQECLNAVQATRAAARNAATPEMAAIHLDRAETAARAGRGQLCQDELTSAADSQQ